MDDQAAQRRRAAGTVAARNSVNLTRTLASLEEAEVAAEVAALHTAWQASKAQLLGDLLARRQNLLTHVGQGHKLGAQALCQRLQDAVEKEWTAHQAAQRQESRLQRAIEEMRVTSAQSSRVSASARVLRRAVYSAGVPVPAVPGKSSPVQPLHPSQDPAPHAYLTLDSVPCVSPPASSGLVRTLTAVSKHAPADVPWTLPAPVTHRTPSTAGVDEAKMRQGGDWAATGASVGMVPGPAPVSAPEVGGGDPESMQGVMPDDEVLAWLGQS